MSLLYGRIAQVVVGPPNGTGRLIGTQTNVNDNGTKQTTDLRIKFKVEKTSESNPNTMSLELYNLSRDTQALCKRAGNAVILRCGYEGNVPLIFSGDIAKVTTEKQGADMVTTVEACDGQISYDTSTIDASFAPGATVESIFNQVVGSFGVGLGPILGLPKDKVNNGMSISGDSKKVLDELAKKNGLEWSIQDGQIQVHPKNQPVFGTAVLLNSETGLIGSPKNVKILKASQDPVLDPALNKDSGVSFKALLNPMLKPGQLVKLDSVNLQGLYTIRKVTHQGDTYSSTWESDCDAI